jgi:hypothetical protein
MTPDLSKPKWCDSPLEVCPARQHDREKRAESDGNALGQTHAFLLPLGLPWEPIAVSPYRGMVSNYQRTPLRGTSRSSPLRHKQ